MTAQRRTADKNKILNTPENGFLLSVRTQDGGFYLDITKEQAFDCIDEGMFLEYNEYGVATLNCNPTPKII